MGSELQARGAHVIARTRSAKESVAWTSALANLKTPELVQEIHRDYLRVGADIIISNNFSTSPSHLEMFGLEHEWERYTDAAVSLAISTRNEFKPEAAVVAGFAAPGSVARDRTRTCAQSAGGDDAFVNECRAMGQRLAERGADAVIVEILRYATDAALAISALSDLEVPVYLGLLADNDQGLSSGESYDSLAEALNDGPAPDGIFLHCGKTAAISAGLPRLASRFSGVIGGYGNVGYDSGAFLDESQRGNWFNTRGETPHSFAQTALDWVDAGAKIVGGCCATGPEHILMLKTLLSERS